MFGVPELAAELAQIECCTEQEPSRGVAADPVDDVGERLTFGGKAPLQSLGVAGDDVITNHAWERS